ncbi:MAG: hypothetical protein C5B51_05000 [Terriglobia bacterium]|nr:MAG: hypothetical protein C5B51_05000 [Terriglobia bacterium]
MGTSATPSTVCGCTDELESWHVDGHSLTIRYSPPVLEDIRRAAVDGFNLFARGGLEIGGILWGTRTGEVVDITASSPIECNHARGPGFALSPEDETALAAQLNDSPEPSLVAVGFYCSHTRSKIALGTADQEIYGKFFPEPWQAVLVVKPTRWGPADAGFFFREGGGAIRVDSSYQEFQIQPLKSAPEREELAVAAEPQLTRAETAPVFAVSGRRRWPWVLSAAGAVVIAAAAILTSAVHPPPRLGLRTYELAGQMRIEWDRSASVLAASRGLVEISDGGRHTIIPLDKTALHSSSVTYAQSSNDVQVRLRIDGERFGPNGVEEFARFIGPSPAPNVSTDLAKPPAPDPRPSARQTGRLIWTGALAPSDVVEIDSGQANKGSISGSLPGVPVALRVYPAEFGPNGLVVYSGDPAAGNREEAPGRNNGWNATQFQWNPVRAGELKVVEAPSTSNHFNRLVLRNLGRKRAVILVEWTIE